MKTDRATYSERLLQEIADRLKALDGRVARLEAAVPKPPQPAKPAPLPSWIPPQGDFGSSYAGAPSGTSAAGGSGPAYGRATNSAGEFKPDGVARDPLTGEVIVKDRPAVRPVGPQIDHKHRAEIALLDRAVPLHSPQADLYRVQERELIERARQAREDEWHE